MVDPTRPAIVRSVIPGRRNTSRNARSVAASPAIHRHESGLWIPGLRLRSAMAELKPHPGMTRGHRNMLVFSSAFALAHLARADANCLLL
jgi:hypothetical protein